MKPTKKIYNSKQIYKESHTLNICCETRVQNIEYKKSVFIFSSNILQQALITVINRFLVKYIEFIKKNNLLSYVILYSWQISSSREWSKEHWLEFSSGDRERTDRLKIKNENNFNNNIKQIYC